METFSTLLDICVGNLPVADEFPAQRPVTRNCDVFFDLHPNKRSSKQPWGWWFETPARSSCNVVMKSITSNCHFRSIEICVVIQFNDSDKINFNSCSPGQNGRHFANDIFKCTFVNKNVLISKKNWLKIVLKGPIDNTTALVQIIAWRRSGDKPLSEPIMSRWTGAYMLH